MEKQEIKSKWDDLARQIGADLSPEAEQRAETHATAKESAGPPISAEQAVRTPLPKKPTADWAGLAGELGLPPIEDEPLPVEKPATNPPRRDEVREAPAREAHSSESRSREPRSREPQQRERQNRDQPSRDSRGPRRGRGGRGRGGRTNDERDGGESSGQRREQRGRRSNRGDARSDSYEQRRTSSDQRRDTGESSRESQQQRDSELESFDDPASFQPPAEDVSAATPEREPPAKSPAVSLWHKIFGAPAEPTAREAETSEEKTPEFRESEASYQSDDTGRGEIRSLSGEDVTAADFVDESIAESTLDPEDVEPKDRDRGRPRRRRRGGRGRKSRGGQREGRSAEPRVHESGGDDQLDADFDDLSDDESEMSDDDNLLESQPVNGDSDLENSEGEPTPTHARSMSAAQRAIPSWDDAIGFIVESNMQSRSQRPRPSRSDSRGNSRGRSRGGRRK